MYLKIPSLLACIKLVRSILKAFNSLDSELYTLVFPDFVLTAKPNEVRMGGGKGDLGDKVCMLKKGDIIFLVTNLDPFCANFIKKGCLNKLSPKCSMQQASY